MKLVQAFAPLLQPQWITGNVSKGFWERFSLEAHLNGHHVWKCAGHFSITACRLCVAAPYRFIRIAGCVWAHFKPQDFWCIFSQRFRKTTKHNAQTKLGKSRPACQRWEIMLSVQLQFPSIVPHKTGSNNCTWLSNKHIGETVRKHPRTQYIFQKEEKPNIKHDCVCVSALLTYWSMSWHNTRCLKGLHYGDKGKFSCAA